MTNLTIIGGGLSGCEAAWQAAERGISVSLYEMRPAQKTGAHQTGDLSELVCSNSLGSLSLDRSSGLLIKELELLNSLLINTAKSFAVPAGHALAVDRKLFSHKITELITSHPNIRLIRKEVQSIPEGLSIIASGPLTSKSLAKAISKITGDENLFFYDAIAPIIEFDSINMNIAFWGSRYGKGSNKHGDYINCPINKYEYKNFISELLKAERIKLQNFEKDIIHGVWTGKGKFFEGCLPIEIMAQRGLNTLAFGPLRPVGLINPRTKNRPYAIVQLRQDDLMGDFYNIVGFQTNLKHLEQKRVFRLIPGLENAEFVRFGQMHRNTFINSPLFLNRYFQLVKQPNTFFCGQITGIEGYLANIASGLYVGINSAKLLLDKEMVIFPPTSMMGALNKYIINKVEDGLQPMKPNFGLLPSLANNIKPKKVRHQAYSDRAIKDIRNFIIKSEI